MLSCYLLKGDSIHISLPAWEIDVVSAIFTETTQSTAHPRFQLYMRECASVCVCECVCLSWIYGFICQKRTICEILSQSQGETTWAIPEATLQTRSIVAPVERAKNVGMADCVCVYIRKLLAILLKNDTTDIKESE